MPSCYKIYEYWKDKRILENGEISDTLGKGVRVVENPSLACCWACGRPVKRSDVLSWDKYDKDEKYLWSDKRVNSKLQKCHILAKQFDGPDTPENLFLMCQDCHIESPDTQNRNAFFRWVYRKRKKSYCGFDMEVFFSELKSEIEIRGYEFKSFLKELYDEKNLNVGELTEKGLKNCGCHGTSVVESTMAICVVDSLVSGLEKEKVHSNELDMIPVDCGTERLKELCKLHKVSYRKVCARIRRGLTVEQAMMFPSVPRQWSHHPMEYWKQCGCL